MRRRRGSIATAIAATTVVGTVAVATLPAATALMGLGCCIVRGSLAISRVGSPVATTARTAQNPVENQYEQPEDDGEEQEICDQ